MTATIRKQIERSRNKQAGLRRVEVVLHKDFVDLLDKTCASEGVTRPEALASAIMVWANSK